MNTEPNQDPIAEPPADESDVTMTDETLKFSAAGSGEATENEVDSLRHQLMEMEKTALRHQADLENYRKRSRTQMQDQLRYASLPLISELLESVDNLNRATDSAQADAEASGLVEGVRMVSTQISNLLEQHGCKRIEAVGKPFDPSFHQAVQMQPSDEFEANTVMHEIRAGFILHDRVVRPAQVFVSTGPATGDE